MKSEIVDLLAEFIRQAEPDLDSRLETQAEELNTLPCIEPVIGKWVDAHDVEFLLAAFALDDEEFTAEFPSLAHFSQDDRQRIMETFQSHFERCMHCSRKQSYDLEFDSRVDGVLQNRKTELLRYLDHAATKEESADDEHNALPVDIAVNN